MKITASNLIRWAGLSAVVGGSLFVGIQPVHPPELLSSVTTGTWTLVHAVGVAMCLLILLGLAGLYARQAERAGWLGLAGFLLFGLMWALTAPFQFAEAFILPLLAAEAPAFAAGFLGGARGGGRGGLLGVATLRAGVLPRWAGGALVVGAVAPLALGLLLPHEYIRLAAVPGGA